MNHAELQVIMDIPMLVEIIFMDGFVGGHWD